MYGSSRNASLTTNHLPLKGESWLQIKCAYSFDDAPRTQANRKNIPQQRGSWQITVASQALGANPGALPGKLNAEILQIEYIAEWQPRRF